MHPNQNDDSSPPFVPWPSRSHSCETSRPRSLEAEEERETVLSPSESRRTGSPAPFPLRSVSCNVWHTSFRSRRTSCRVCRSYEPLTTAVVAHCTPRTSSRDGSPEAENSTTRTLGLCVLLGLQLSTQCRSAIFWPEQISIPRWQRAAVEGAAWAAAYVSDNSGLGLWLESWFLLSSFAGAAGGQQPALGMLLRVTVTSKRVDQRRRRRPLCRGEMKVLIGPRGRSRCDKPWIPRLLPACQWNIHGVWNIHRAGHCATVSLKFSEPLGPHWSVIGRSTLAVEFTKL
ncbi:hypothetical protein FB451DRAFT_1372807 [Mycena latifolia]|nr:hypothetical protein FB451DRAFT_1372807 [Mycena latifolia]